MSPDPAWPSSSSELVLWMEAVSIWILASYGTASDALGKDRDSNRSRLDNRALLAVGVVGSIGWLLPPPGTGLGVRLALSVLPILAMMIHLAVRAELAMSHLRRLAEWEIGTCVVVSLASATVVGLGQIGSAPPASVVRSGKFAAAICVAASIAFVLRGATYVVRSVLDKANAVPRRPHSDFTTAPSALIVDVQELNRGRAIGNLERLLMLMAIALGSYEALGFLVAAKGLIRAHEFENRDFAEYFILGSLASVAVAFVAGTLLRVSLRYLWTLP